MKKEDIIDRLSTNHNDFIGFINSLSQKEFESAIREKWTPGQQLEHIYLGLRPLTGVLQSIEFLIQKNFGRSNGKSRDYDTVVEEYRALLKTGLKTTERFEPKTIKFENRDELAEKLASTVDQLCANIGKLSEQELDDFFIPHPALKNLTIREMMYFTIYHLEHHYNQVKQNLK